MVCSLRSSSAGRSEVVHLDTNALELIPNILFLQDITISNHGKICIGVENKFCPSCRDKLGDQESASTDVGQLYKLLCDSCKKVLVEYAKTTLTASKGLLRCSRERCSTSGEPVVQSVKKKIRTIPKSTSKCDPQKEENNQNLGKSLGSMQISDEFLMSSPSKIGLLSQSESEPETAHIESNHLLPEDTSVLVLLDDCKKDFRSECIPARYGTADVPTIFEKLLQSGIDWCRYCGTTNGVNWRPGPWGKKTLCNRHGCNFKGYGFAAHKPKLDLRNFLYEPLSERNIPIVKEYCFCCQSKISTMSNPLIFCHGCPRSFHTKCYQSEVGTVSAECTLEEGKPWFCNTECMRNIETLTILIELPKKSMPFSITTGRSSPVQRKTGTRPISRKPKSPCNSFLSSYRKSKESLDSFTYDSELIGKLSQCPLETSRIQLPKWSFYQSDTVIDDDGVAEDDTTDDIYIQRHLSFENLERNNKLLFGLHGCSTTEH